jgi:hypothetical protein
MPHINLGYPTNLPTEKHCYKCGLTKPIDLFAKSKQSPDGRTNECQQCTTARHRQEKADRELRLKYNKIKRNDERSKEL